MKNSHIISLTTIHNPLFLHYSVFSLLISHVRIYFCWELMFIYRSNYVNIFWFVCLWIGSNIFHWSLLQHLPQYRYLMSLYFLYSITSMFIGLSVLYIQSLESSLQYHLIQDIYFPSIFFFVIYNISSLYNDTQFYILCPKFNSCRHHPTTLIVT